MSENNFFSCLVNDDTYNNGQEKNNILYTDMAVEVLLGSTQNASTTCSNGVEPQTGSTQVLPSSAALAFDPGSLVGKIVSDDEMTDLYMTAHRAGFALTSELVDNTAHRVTGCRKA